jgi:Family of unknown function (DUF5677)
MLESFAHLMIIMRQPEYIQQLKFEDATNQVVMYRALQENYNPTAPPQYSLEDIVGWIRFYDGVIAESKTKGCKRQTIKDKLTQAGYSRLYQLYQILCSHTHSQLATLFERHGQGPLFHYKRPDDTEGMVRSCLDVAVNILCDGFGQYLKLTEWTEAHTKLMLAHIQKGWRDGSLRIET